MVSPCLLHSAPVAGGTGVFSLGNRVGGIGGDGIEGDEAVSQFCAIYIFPLCTIKKPPPCPVPGGTAAPGR